MNESDTTKIEAALSAHRIECTGGGEVSCRCRDPKGWMSWAAYHRHVAEAVAAVLAAQPTETDTADSERWNGTSDHGYDAAPAVPVTTARDTHNEPRRFEPSNSLDKMLNRYDGGCS